MFLLKIKCSSRLTSQHDEHHRLIQYMLYLFNYRRFVLNFNSREKEFALQQLC